jgi:hypothetical protein
VGIEVAEPPTVGWQLACREVWGMTQVLQNWEGLANQKIEAPQFATAIYKTFVCVARTFTDKLKVLL